MSTTNEEWDARYAEQEQTWSGQPNALLVREAEALVPGRVLDVGCGEGADAVWLAQRGWRVTAIDVSGVALDRARAREAAPEGSESGTGIDWRLCALEDYPPAAGFDLVSAFYPALPSQSVALERLLAAVAPGGTLLFVHHVMTHHHDGEHEHRFDPSDYVSDADVEAALGHGWSIEAHETLDRDVRAGRGAHHSQDVLLRARRSDHLAR